jgi:hypothetical protein
MAYPPLAWWGGEIHGHSEHYLPYTLFISSALSGVSMAILEIVDCLVFMIRILWFESVNLLRVIQA